jgi:hypothetical protein
MLLGKNLAITVFLLALLFTYSVSAVQVIYNNPLCLLEVEFESEPQKKQQIINLNANVKMSIWNRLAIQNHEYAKIATNTGCQKLVGASYTGSAQEWAKFFDSAVSGLVKANYQDVTFTLVGDTEKVYSPENGSKFLTKEYTFIAKIKDNKQVIRNLAILDKLNNTLYTFSVSGSIRVEAEIAKEFERLVASLKPINYLLIK